MPLTPEDVRKVGFGSPPLFRQGYTRDEVDAFMDQVEAEPARLDERVEELEERLRG